MDASRDEALPTTRLDGTFLTDFQPPQLGENECPSSKAPSVTFCQAALAGDPGVCRGLPPGLCAFSVSAA